MKKGTKKSYLITLISVLQDCLQIYKYSLFSIITTTMFCQTRRSTTPTKTMKKQKSHPVQHVKPPQPLFNKQNKNQNHSQSQTPIQPLPLSDQLSKQKLSSHTQPSTSRDNCQSPTLTFIGSHLQSQSQNRNDLEQALRLALEMVQGNRKQIQEERSKVKDLGEQITRLKQECKQKQGRSNELEESLEKQIQKYKKLKQKYRDLKQQKQSSPPPKSTPNSTPYLTNPYSNPTDNHLLETLQQRNLTIKHLCHQIQEYQQNSQNILKMVNVLQQRVQQLTMDNNLLKGILRENQISESDSCATVYNVDARKMEEEERKGRNIKNGMNGKNQYDGYGGVFGNVYENLHGGHSFVNNNVKNPTIGDRCIEGNRFIKEYEKLWSSFQETE